MPFFWPCTEHGRIWSGRTGPLKYFSYFEGSLGGFGGVGAGLFGTNVGDSLTGGRGVGRGSFGFGFGGCLLSAAMKCLHS